MREQDKRERGPDNDGQDSHRWAIRGRGLRDREKSEKLVSAVHNREGESNNEPHAEEQDRHQVNRKSNERP
jgi:hypothetical protein